MQGKAPIQHHNAYYLTTIPVIYSTGFFEREKAWMDGREETLKALAIKLADKAVAKGRKIKLEPMNPFERRIIHTALQEDGRVSTLSKGEEPKRYVMIFPTDAE